jgi:RHS repeat-associated protein
MPHQKYAFGLLTTTLTDNSDGTLYSSADALGHTTYFASYYRGQAQNITLPDTNVLGRKINDSGTVASVTDARGYMTSFYYDPINRLQQVDYPANDTVAWAPRNITYQTLATANTQLGLAAGTFYATSSDGALVRNTDYDPELRKILVQETDSNSGLSRYTASTYDFKNEVTFQSYPSATPQPTTGINSVYDALGRLTQKSSTDGTVLESVHYLAGDTMQVIDASGNITSIQFQAFDTPDSTHPTVISAPQGQTTTISRNLFGDPVSATQSGGGVSLTRSMIYDSYERLCKQVDPEKGQTVFYYDAASRIRWEAEGQAGSPTACDYGSVPTTAQIAFTYDPLNRKTAITYPDSSGNVTYGYDPDGHFKSSVNPTASLTYTYDKRGLLQSEGAAIDQGGGTLTYGYTPQANLATKTTPSGLQLSDSPDAWGEPTTITNATTNTAYASGILYYPNGTPSAYTLGNGLVYSAALDSRQRLQQQQVKNGTTLLQSLAYGYNNDNDLLNITDGVNGSSGDTASFTPDGLHRLSTANGLWGSYTYGYDALNNLTSRTGSSALSYTYNYTSNQLTSVSGAQSRSNSYDAVGHVTADGTYRYTWNDADQITAIPGVATYDYDANGKRAKRNTASASEYDFYDLSGSLAYRYELYSNTQTDEIELAGQTIAEVSSVLVTGTPTFTATYLHPDLLGSPRLATSSSKAVLWTQHYDPYGTRMVSVNEKIGYTGHSFDAESNLTYAKARYYDAQLGRFLSTDPVAFTGSPFSFNRYSYASNSPYAHIDSTGAEDEVVTLTDSPATGTHLGGDINTDGHVTFANVPTITFKAGTEAIASAFKASKSTVLSDLRDAGVKFYSGNIDVSYKGANPNAAILGSTNPSGNINIFEGMLLGYSDKEMASLIGHELNHVYDVRQNAVIFGNKVLLINKGINLLWRLV